MVRGSRIYLSETFIYCLMGVTSFACSRSDENKPTLPLRNMYHNNNNLKLFEIFEVLKAFAKFMEESNIMIVVFRLVKFLK